MSFIGRWSVRSKFAALFSFSCIRYSCGVLLPNRLNSLDIYLTLIPQAAATSDGKVICERFSSIYARHASYQDKVYRNYIKGINKEIEEIKKKGTF